MKVAFSNIPLDIPEEWFVVLRRRFNSGTPEYTEDVQDNDTRAYKHDCRWGGWQEVPYPTEEYIVRLELRSDDTCYHALDIVIEEQRDKSVVYRRNILDDERLPREPGKVVKYSCVCKGHKFVFNICVSRTVA